MFLKEHLPSLGRKNLASRSKIKQKCKMRLQDSTIKSASQDLTHLSYGSGMDKRQGLPRSGDKEHVVNYDRAQEDGHQKYNSKRW